MDLITAPEKLKGWLPIQIQWAQQADPLVDWCRVGDCRFTEPFFDLTIERVLRNPFNLMFRQMTSIEVLEQCAARIETIQPSGFIFHLSRCGSTLVSQMLSCLPQNVVISEASVLDWMIRANVRRPDMSDEERIDWIRWMVGALGQKRTPEAKHLFIKFDSWHTLEMEVITRAFPDVPWIFLYRHPTEVLVSQIRMRGAGTVAGMVDLQIGLSLEESFRMPPEEYVSRVLERICESALKFASAANGMFVNYSQLPEFAVSTMLEHFRVDYPEADIETMRSKAKYDAKSPTLSFAGDAEEKRNAADENLRRCSENILMPLYEQLEAVRNNSK